VIRTFLFFFLAITAFAQPREYQIAAIDFYGQGGLDRASLLAGLPFKVGDTVNADAQSALTTLAGRPARANFVYTPEAGLIVYIGLANSATSGVVYKAAPNSHIKMQERIVRLYNHMMDRFAAGGIAAGDDSSKGYSLSNDPVMRKDQLAMIEYAQANSDIVFQVLESSADAGQRVAAAWVAGYAPQNQLQIEALVNAVLDADSTVRNNAMRCLGLLLARDPARADTVPAAPFVRLLHSLTWSDNNKSLMVLGALTARAEAPLRKELGASAIEILRDMAQWRYWGHASMALVVLGRISNIPENRLQELLAAKDRDAILAAVKN
jgi:hypothetical protein